MFAEAYKKAAAFTRPVIISIALPGNRCVSKIGAFVVVNQDGWILTANHILVEADNLHAGRQRLLEHQQARTAIERDGTLNRDQRKKRLRNLGDADPGWPVGYSLWWGWDGMQLADIAFIPDADLAVARLVNFNPAWVTEYPRFRDPTKPIASGTSVCRLGFPFHDITPTYDETLGNFTLPAGAFPMPFFPNEGVVTRVLLFGQAPTHVGMIETSSPGLRGQSGGPIFDRDGCVWGIQSQTRHLPLGFSPAVPGGKPGQVEHQFLNVGLGADPQTISRLLTERGVTYSVA